MRELDPWKPIQAFLSLLEAQVSTGTEYYLCAPPGLAFPSDVQQSPSLPVQTTQSPPPSTLTDPDPTSDPINTTTTEPMQGPSQEGILDAFSPTILAQPQHIPSTSKKRNDPAKLQFKELGEVGHHDLPLELLQQLLPQHNPEVQPNLAVEPFHLPEPYEHTADMQKFLKQLPTKVLTPVPESDWADLMPLYHAAAYLIPKPASKKVSLILNLRGWNHSQLHKPPPFHLPTVYSLG